MATRTNRIAYPIIVCVSILFLASCRNHIQDCGKDAYNDKRPEEVYFHITIEIILPILYRTMQLSRDDDSTNKCSCRYRLRPHLYEKHEYSCYKNQLGNIREIFRNRIRLSFGEVHTRDALHHIYLLLPKRYFFGFSSRSIKSSATSRSLLDVDFPNAITSTWQP